jgi:hypothetical protein
MTWSVATHIFQINLPLLRFSQLSTVYLSGVHLYLSVKRSGGRTRRHYTHTAKSSEQKIPYRTRSYRILVQRTVERRVYSGRKTRAPSRLYCLQTLEIPPPYHQRSEVFFNFVFISRLPSHSNHLFGLPVPFPIH